MRVWNIKDSSLNFSHIYAHVVSTQINAEIISSTRKPPSVPFQSRLSSPKGTTICHHQFCLFFTFM